MGNLLEIKDLFVEYRTDEGTVQAVNGVNLELSAGETLGVVGETGAGKSTMVLSILQLIQIPPGKIVSGEIFYNGIDLLKKNARSMRKIRGGKISMIFQDPMTSLNPVLSVQDQLIEVIQLHQKVSQAEAIKRAIKMLELVGISSERLNDYPHQFSGGMKQRVVIAIALACNPELLIADEPTTALDVTIQAQVIDLMDNLKRQFNTSVLLVTHDLGIVAEICDRVAIMYAGEIIECGTISDIYSNMLHPYTKGLFGSIPNLTVETSRLQPVNGMMPDPTRLPEGCRFKTRCPYVHESCDTAPPVCQYSPGHIVKCWLWSKKPTMEGM